MRKIVVFIATFLFFILMGLIGLYSDLLMTIIHGYTNIDKYRHVKPTENTSFEREVIFFEDPFISEDDKLISDFGKYADVSVVDYWDNNSLLPKLPHTIYEDTIEKIHNSPSKVILSGVDTGATFALEIASDNRVQKHIQGVVLYSRGYDAPSSYKNIVTSLCKGACFAPNYPTLIYTSVFNNSLIDPTYSQDMLSHNGSLMLIQTRDFGIPQFRTSALSYFINNLGHEDIEPLYLFETSSDYREFKKMLEEKQKDEPNSPSLTLIRDLETDNSITKFVGPGVPFNNREYIPNLTPIIDENIIDTKGNAQIRPEAFEVLKNMAQQFNKDTGEKIIVVSSYRSYLYQKGIKDRGCPDELCSKAGESEHQSGLAIDLWEASDETSWKSNADLSRKFEWLNNNAHKYGFHNSYQKGKQIDGYDVEPWHWRYVGVSLANELREKNMTFTQYYHSVSKKN